MTITMKILGNIAWKGDEPTEVVTKNFEEGVIKPGDKLLDVGCGFGRNSNWLAGKGVNVTAVNISDEEIKDAREKAEKLGVNVNYLYANAIELPFPDNSFDVVLDLGCSHMISDKEDQKKAESEMARVLKSDGRLVYFGFSKEHPDYLNKPDNPMFRNLEDIQAMYGDDFDILSHEETRWQPKPEEKRDYSEHVGLNLVLKRKAQ
jgi:ubiquinone/menaquinone biosynthesis C-methylase UbiE